MKLNPTMNSAMIKMSINNELQKLYKEYMIFIGKDDLPAFSTELFNAYNNPTSAEAFMSFKNNKYIFNIEQHKFMLFPDTVKSLAFHEFTHIWDDCIFLQELAYNERKKLTHWFTEYHAVQIDMMCACGFDNISSAKILDDNTMIFRDNHPKILKEYIDFSYKGFIITIDNYMKNGCSPKDAVYTVLHTVYHQSQCDFFKKYYKPFEYDKYQNACKIICGESFIELIKSITDEDITKDIKYFQYHDELSTNIGKYIFENQNAISDFTSKEIQNI